MFKNIMKYLLVLLVILKTGSTENLSNASNISKLDLEPEDRKYDPDKVLFFNVDFRAFFVFIEKTLNWHQAYEYCRSLKMRLASPLTLEINTALKKFLQDNELTKNKEFWISLNDLANVNDFKWLATGTSPAYADWWVTKPNNPTDRCAISRCIKYDYLSSNSSGWVDNNCLWAHHFICEK